MVDAEKKIIPRRTIRFLLSGVLPVDVTEIKIKIKIDLRSPTSIQNLGQTKSSELKKKIQRRSCKF